MKPINESLNKKFYFRLGTVCAFSVTIVLMTISLTMAASSPKTVAEVALYRGPDREQMLIEGAKQEGELMLYNSNSWMTNVVSKAFEKKYPFLKVSVARTTTKTILKRVMEEYSAGRSKVDAIETASGGILILNKNGLLQEYYTPEAAYYPEDVKAQGKIGVYYLGDRELYYGLGFNTDAISPDEAPKNLLDLLDPKWKGKMSIDGGATATRWIGTLMHAKGRDYIEKLSRQDLRTHNITPAAMITLVVSGEVPLCPTLGRTNATLARKKGAHVAWRPFTPTLTTVGASGMITRAPHPHAALLFLDYLHSKEGQEVVMRGELNSPRTDIGSVEEKFEKYYVDTQFPVEVYEKKFSEWENMLKQLFITKH